MVGRVRTVYIKSLATKLLEENPDKFASDFEKNKEVLNDLINTESKNMRNRIAGYITRMMNRKEKFHTLKVSYQPREPERRRGRRRRRR